MIAEVQHKDRSPYLTGASPIKCSDMKVEPRNRSWTRPSGPRWGALARRDDDAGSPPARRSNAASVRQGGSIGCVALSPIW